MFVVIFTEIISFYLSQVWSVPACGESVEVLSWNQRVVRVLRFLPAPESQKSALRSDPFAHKRPLVAIVDNTGPGPHFCSVNFISLHGGDQVCKFSRHFLRFEKCYEIILILFFLNSDAN